jgi:hypothetical protein
MEKVSPEQLVWNVVNRNLFFVRSAIENYELKTSDKFDLFDAETQRLLLECREPEIEESVKARRALGGSEDAHTPFDLVGKLPGHGPRAFRIARGTTTFNLSVAPVEIFDHRNELLGRIKKKTFAFGLAFNFTGENKDDALTFEVKTTAQGKGAKIFIDGKEVAGFTPVWNELYGEFFKQGKFRRASGLPSQSRPSLCARYCWPSVPSSKESINDGGIGILPLIPGSQFGVEGGETAL